MIGHIDKSRAFDLGAYDSSILSIIWVDEPANATTSLQVKKGHSF